MFFSIWNCKFMVLSFHHYTRTLILGCIFVNQQTLVNLGIAKRIHSFIQNTNEIYESVMEVADSKVMKEKAMKMKNAIDNQMTWESIIKQIEALV